MILNGKVQVVVYLGSVLGQSNMFVHFSLFFIMIIF